MTNRRLDAFHDYAHHAWLSRSYQKLTRAEYMLCARFIMDNTGLSKADFERAVNRMFLDQPKKPRHWKEMQELLTCANSAIG